MKCPECGKANPPGSKYCNQCGAGLQGSCRDIEPHTEKTTPRLTPEAERKHVTALFSDLTGYTSMAEKLDPEQVKEITGRIFSGIKKIVAKYEGFIERVMGDGVLAFFGVPHSHEDDPIRSIQAALEIHNLVKALNPEYEGLVGAPLTMHSGINTGLVVTADVDPEKGTHGVAGDAVNVASRLSGLASPGEILVSEETVRRTKDRFVFQDLGMKRVKGKTDPINVFNVISVKASTQVIPTGRHVSSEMVGRDRELDRLELQVMKVINGEGSVVNVVGEAGIGKSRLIAELKKSSVMRKVTLLEGRAISIGKNLSFHPIIDLLKQWAGIAEDDSENKAFDKLERAIRRIHPEQVSEILPFLATLMGIKLRGKHAERLKEIAGEPLEKLIFHNVRELTIKGSELRPTVMVMEDLHWADETSLGLLESLYPLAEKHRILFINVFRPGYWKSKDSTSGKISGLSPNHFVEIAIEPLDKESSEALIGNLLDIKGLPYSLSEQISARTGGNPFFIEEVVRSLIDDGAIVQKDGSFEVTDKIDSVVIPPTIDDVLMARLDRLEERTRELVKVASVIGRTFFDRIIKDVATSIDDIDGRLAYLKDLQLIRDRTRMEEVEYLFKHALAQEVAYESTLIQQRKALHLKVAQSIEKLFQDRLHEFYGMLAYHYSQAENFEKAEDYMVKAGEEALRSSASSEAINYFQQALQIYIGKNVGAANPEILAVFEKNIALAYFNKGKYQNALHYFDMVFQRWGRRLPKTKPGIIAKLAYDFLIVLLRLYLPSITQKRIPDQHVNEFLRLALARGSVLAFANPLQGFTEMVGEYRETLRYDLARLDTAAAFHLHASAGFSLVGLLGMADKMLVQARKLVDKEKIVDVIYYQMVTSMHNYVAGKWAEIPEYDKELFDAGMNNGLFFQVTFYLYWYCSFQIYQGKFCEVNELLANLAHLWERYEYDWAGAGYYRLVVEFRVTRRHLWEAQSEANNLVGLWVERGLSGGQLAAVGWKAVVEVFVKDIMGAKDSLGHAHKIRRKQVFWSHWHLSSGVLAQFMLDLQMLEDAIGGESRPLISKYSKTALKSGKEAIRNSAKFAAHRTWNYHMMGRYYWLVGKQKRAFQWFDRSIKEGERLGARPDIARTYMEVGERLLEPHSKYRELDGLTGNEYLQKAETMFLEMDLQWDLDELEKVRQQT